MNNVVLQDPQKVLAEELEANRFGGARPKTTPRSTRPTLENDIKSPCGLPDFVQDYLGVEHEMGPVAGHVDGYSCGQQAFRNAQAPVDNPLDLPRSHSPIHAAGIKELLTGFWFYLLNVFMHRGDANTFGYCEFGHRSYRG